jgi:hypothetical protein
MNYLQILKAFSWSIARADEVKTALLNAESEVEAEILLILERLTELDDLISTELGSANYALIEADVLKWASPEARSQGMLFLKSQLTQQLANLLGLSYQIPGISGGTVSVQITNY